MFSGITRVEVIDLTGRAFTAYYESESEVTFQIQDDGRTLKMFVDTPTPAEGTEVR